MNIFIVTSTVFSQAATGASYHISEREAHIAATGWVSHDHGEVYEWHY